MIENLTEKILIKICNKINKECPESIKDTIIQFVKFGIVGVTNTIISYLLYVGSLLFLKHFGILHKVDYLVAQTIAFILSVLWSFYWNNKMVFKLDENQFRNPWKALMKSFVAYSFTGLFLNSLLLILWIKVLGISEFIAPIINLLVSVPVNFIMNKLWAFRTNNG